MISFSPCHLKEKDRQRIQKQIELYLEEKDIEDVGNKQRKLEKYTRDVRARLEENRFKTKKKRQ